ncbi:MAG: 16S rRNA (guanine(966)-N(2))-methyltransferase RsmD [Alphaproteobacteria bacterium]|jgi:16S rRNA (guanine966-N2)-methyltransferase|nr:16S rRNA (guanine(966)-N(2))-methyltransferase RsmD [Alphaproteobacteria bacterium]
MRIVAGRYGGRAITAPRGRGTRPTSDRAREALFNIISHADWAPQLEGARIIDLFAGSGALGLEAISRGAQFCLFVETDAGARGAIRENIEALGLHGVTRLHRRSASDLGKRPAGLGAPFDLAFLDPPYGQGLAERALDVLASGDWVAAGALAIVETGAGETLAAPGWRELDMREQGAACLWFLARAG